MSLSYTKLVGRDASFQLIRTNPKLTSNLKVSVDSKGDVWMNAIQADPELAKDQYQKFAVDLQKSHEFNVFNFYDNGKTPSKISFAIGSTITQTVTARDLKNQYEFDFYTSGAKYLESKQYSEKYSYLAPLYLNSALPDCFVVFKVKGASNYAAGTQINETISKRAFTTEFFRSMQLVKVFDMRPESNIGGYLERILENPMRPNAPLSINFNQAVDSYSYYKGLSISSGTYVELPVETNSVFRRGLPILTKEKFIVSGFEANNILHPNILNLEFLFDDPTAAPFEINRYFGFYCNRLELAQFDVDIAASFANPTDNDQALEIIYDITDDLSIPVTNPDGVKLRGKNLTADVTDLNQSLTDESHLFFTYVETKSETHLVEPGSWQQANDSVVFRIDDTKIDFGTLFGPGDLFSQEKATVSEEDSHSTLAFRVDSKPTNGSTVRIYHANGTHTDSTGRFDPLTFVDSAVATPSSFAFNGAAKYSVQYDAVGQSVIYVSADGTIQDIATGLTAAINAMEPTDFRAVRSNNIVFVQIKEAGESFSQVKAISGVQSNITAIGTPVENGLVIADGGTTGSHPIISNGTASIGALPLMEINAEKSNLLIKTSKNWSRIDRVARVTDLILPESSSAVLGIAANRFLDSGTLILTDNETPLVAHGNIEIRRIAKNKVGILSIFEVKDFDFDTNKTDYARFDAIDLFKDFFEPAGIPTLNFRRYTYVVVGPGRLSVNDIEYQEGDYVWQDFSDLCKYTVTTGECALVKAPFSPNAICDAFYTEFVNTNSVPQIVTEFETFIDTAHVPNLDTELQNYTGQFSIRTSSLNPVWAQSSYAQLNEAKNRFLQGVVDSEYQVYLENYAVEFALDSKLTPYINKWALKDSMDARSNPYRLNTDPVFGYENFGPSHTEYSPIAEKLTHEWFYIESDFGFKSSPEMIFRNFNYFEEKFNESLFISDPTYFDEYFQYVPTFNGNQIDRVQLRYSDLIRDPFTGQFETVFKGVKYRFFELDESRMLSDGDVQEAILNATNRFDGYRFSALLVVDNDSIEDDQPPVRFEIIENQDSKAIVVLIKLRLAGRDKITEDSSLMSLASPIQFSKIQLLSEMPSGNFRFEDLYGDYRIEFNQDEVSNLTYAFLYYAKNKKYNSGETSFSTTKLAKHIDISASGFVSSNQITPGGATIIGENSTAVSIDIYSDSGYETVLSSQVALVPEVYSGLVYVGSGLRIALTDSQTALNTAISGASVDSITFSSPTMYALTITPNGTTPTLALYDDLPVGTTQQWKDVFNLVQVSGGKGYYQNLFQYFSFANFKYLLESKENLISWKSYENGNLTIARRFTVRSMEPNTIPLQSQLVTNGVTVTSNSSTSLGGYTYSESTAVDLEIRRYSGEYDAIFKPVTAFYQKTKIGQYEIDGANCAIHIDIPGVFELPEFNHVKYSDAAILELENSASYLPEYPLINETPIGTAPFFVLSSSWDKGYHWKYPTKSTREPMFGTRRITEDYSFVSKLVNAPDSVFLEEFTISTVTQPQLNSQTFVSMIDYTEYTKAIKFKIDMAQAIATNFKNLGLLDEFKKFFVDEIAGAYILTSPELLGQLTLEKYVEEYAKRNLQRLYKIEEIQIWQRIDKTIPNGTVVIEEKTLDELLEEGYSLTRSVQINNQNSTRVDGSIDRPLNSGSRVSFRIKIKFI